ncbi:retrovirus-related Pol polyprotein from transposon 412 [Trichonephila inaurata madagascariensis]|uniref:Retrovirus-related Pol polyprotein from transposon 412 n=1 Tax=Trichonephila inaurata madagascariensis TaxID=2747483 RepID=A0A8X6IMV2_9ARAC|nr:retrovirus-related Pol polyprotein from transposon 412 [Trichonephila inaurata madagascariensis]
MYNNGGRNEAYLPGTGAILDHEGGSPEQRPAIALGEVDVRHIRKQRLLGVHNFWYWGCVRAAPALTIKETRLIRSEIGKLEIPSSCFEHVHIDLVGPLPPSEGFHFCLTSVYRFSKWPEAFPLVEISAEAITKAFYTDWSSRFGLALRLTADGTQFEASLFHALSQLLGTDTQHTTAYYSAANGQVERFHRQLKAAIMAYGNSQWTIVLPTILMGFRATWKEDLHATTAEMIYGAPIRLPGEFLCPSKSSVYPVTFVGRLRESMQRLSPPTTQHHGQHTISVRKDLPTCNHVFLRTDSLRKGLQPPYESPYKVVDRTEKVFRILRHGKEVSVSIDRLKPAYIPKESEDFLVEVNLKEKVSLHNQRKFKNQNKESREKAVVDKKTQTVLIAEYVLTPSKAKILAIPGGGATCGGCGVLPSLDDIGRGEELTEHRGKK